MKLPFALAKVKSPHRLKLFSFLFFFFFSTFNNTISAADTETTLATWLVRWHMDSPEKIEETCKQIDNYPLTLLTQVRGRADAYYTSTLAPRAEELVHSPQTFDPLSLVLTNCKKQKIHAWLNVYYLWTGDQKPEDPSHPAHITSPWILTDNNGRKVSDYSDIEQKQNWIEGIYADPASENYRNLFVSIVSELINRYKLEGIHLDFIRYPGAQFGHGGILNKHFQEKWGFDPRLLPEKITEQDLKKWLTDEMGPADEILTSGALLWAAMRAGEVTKLVRDVHHTLEKKGKNIKLSTSIFPDYLSAYLEKGQDWVTWAQEGLVDRLYPMSYFGEETRIKKQIQEVVALVPSSTPVYAGLGAYIKTDAQIQQEVKELSVLPVNGVSLFSLGHMLQKTNGVAPYFKAASQIRSNKDMPLQKTFKKHELVDAIQSVTKTHLLSGNEIAEEGVVGIKMSQFAKTSREIIPSCLYSLENKELQTPQWLEMHGIFRFVHPYDSEEKKRKQDNLCQEARQKLKTGISVEQVSRKYSQAGARHFASLLPRYYLQQDKTKDRELAKLALFEISPVMLEEDGYWCYRLTSRGGGDMENFSDMPWPAKRILFREELLNHTASQQ